MQEFCDLTKKKDLLVGQSKAYNPFKYIKDIIPTVIKSMTYHQLHLTVDFTVVHINFKFEVACLDKGKAFSAQLKIGAPSLPHN